MSAVQECRDASPMPELARSLTSSRTSLRMVLVFRLIARRRRFPFAHELRRVFAGFSFLCLAAPRALQFVNLRPELLHLGRGHERLFRLKPVTAPAAIAIANQISGSQRSCTGETPSKCSRPASTAPHGTVAAAGFQAHWGSIE